MAAENLQELFVNELRDIYDAEKQLTKALPKMAKAADSDELRAAFEAHLDETRGHVSRLEDVFKLLGIAARGKPCEGMKGLIGEGEEVMEEMEGSTLDAALIASAQKVEHYEIATYGTLATFAEVLEMEEAKNLLGQTLDEEKAADEKLTSIASRNQSRLGNRRGRGRNPDGHPGRAREPKRAGWPQDVKRVAVAKTIEGD